MKYVLGGRLKGRPLFVFRYEIHSVLIVMSDFLIKFVDM